MARYLSLYRRRTNLIDVNLQSGLGSLIPTRANAASYNFQVASNFDITTSSWLTFQNVPASGGFTSLNARSIAFDGEQFSQSRTPYLTRFRFAPSDYSTIFTSAGVSDLTPIWLRVVQVNSNGTTDAEGYPTITGTVNLNTLVYGSGGSVDTLTLIISQDGGGDQTITFAAPGNRGAIITQINAIVSPGIVASINPNNQLVLISSTGVGASFSIKLEAGSTSLTALGLVSGTVTGAINLAEAPHLILPYSSQPNRPILLSGTAPSGAAIINSQEIQLPLQVNNIQVQNNGSNILMIAFEPSGPEFLLNPFSEEGTNLVETFPASSQIFVRGAGGSTTFSLISALRNNPIQ